MKEKNESNVILCVYFILNKIKLLLEAEEEGFKEESSDV